MSTKTKELPNIKALAEYRLKGKTIKKGQVVSKKDFSNKTEWRNICSMLPKPRGEETADAVGMPKGEETAPAAKKTAAKKDAALPGT